MGLTTLRREYPDTPIAGVGGVIFSGRNVLLVRRRNEPSKNMWGLPGGVVESQGVEAVQVGLAHADHDVPATQPPVDFREVHK